MGGCRARRDRRGERLPGRRGRASRARSARGLSLIPQIHVRATPLGHRRGGRRSAATQLARRSASPRASRDGRRSPAASSRPGRRARSAPTPARAGVGVPEQPRCRRDHPAVKQLRAAQIREAIAEHEWHNHQQQIKNAEEIERSSPRRPKTGKTTNQALLRLDEARGEGPVRPVLPVRLRRRQEGRAGAAARARRPEPHASSGSATWPGRRACSRARSCCSTSSGWRWPTTTSTGASTS